MSGRRASCSSAWPSWRSPRTEATDSARVVAPAAARSASGTCGLRPHRHIRHAPADGPDTGVLVLGYPIAGGRGAERPSLRCLRLACANASGPPRRSGFPSHLGATLDRHGDAPGQCKLDAADRRLGCGGRRSRRRRGGRGSQATD